MSWKAVGPVVQKVVSRIVDTGDAGAATPAVSQKNAESTKLPASTTGQRQREGEALGRTANPGQEEFRAPLTVSRHRRVTSPNGSPRPVARLCLVIDNSGRSPAGRRSNEAPADRSSPRGQAREFLRLVSG